VYIAATTARLINTAKAIRFIRLDMVFSLLLLFYLMKMGLSKTQGAMCDLDTA